MNKRIRLPEAIQLAKPSRVNYTSQDVSWSTPRSDTTGISMGVKTNPPFDVSQPYLTFPIPDDVAIRYESISKMIEAEMTQQHHMVIPMLRTPDLPTPVGSLNDTERANALRCLCLATEWDQVLTQLYNIPVEIKFITSDDVSNPSLSEITW